MNNARNGRREPRFNLVKRVEMTRGQSFLLNLAAVMIAIIAGGILILCIGKNPFAFYGTVIAGCFKSALSIKSLIRIIVPLLIASLGVIPAFRMKFWNIGGEGQFIMGAVAASAVALFMPDNFPHTIIILCMAVAGIIGGWHLGADTRGFQMPVRHKRNPAHADVQLYRIVCDTISARRTVA